MSGSYKEEFKKEVDDLYTKFHLSGSYRKKKLIIWVIRTILTIIIYIMFWKYTWIRWTLILYIPLSLFNLFALLGWNLLLAKKMRQLKRKIDEAGK
jgi:hypothetical protein